MTMLRKQSTQNKLECSAAAASVKLSTEREQTSRWTGPGDRSDVGAPETCRPHERPHTREQALVFLHKDTF